MAKQAMDADVVVIGYGPVGALAALLLGRVGVRTVVVERHRDVYPYPRAVAADDDVLRLLRNAGLQKVVSGMLPAQGARFVHADGRRLLDVDLDGPRWGGPGLALYRQPDLEHALRQRVDASSAVSVRLGESVVGIRQDSAGVTIPLSSGDSLRARYVIACDGARSPVRGWLGVDTVGPDASQSWLVVDVLGSPPPEMARDRVTYVCEPGHAAVRMPTPAGWRLEVLLPVGTVPDGPVDVALARRLAGHHLPGDVLGVERACAYTFASRSAARWRIGRVLLAGDAAHTMPPFAGQGLAAGLRDVVNLTWKLGLVSRGNADARLLDSYEKERRTHVRRMTALTTATGAVVTAPPAIAVARDTALRAVAASRVGPWLAGVGVRPRRVLSRSAWRSLPAASRGGQMMPCPDVRDARGVIRPLDSLLSPGFVLLGADVDPLGLLTPQARALWNDVGGTALRVVPPGGVTRGRPAVEDVQGHLLTLLAPGQVMIVRPDLVVAGVVRQPAASAAFLSMAERLTLRLRLGPVTVRELTAA